MSMDLERQEFSTEPQYFEAGVTTPIKTAVKVAGEALEAHAPVLLAEDKAKKVTDASAEGLYGITMDSAEQDKEVVIALTGEFFADSLILEESVKAKDLEIPFRELGIFLIDVKEETDP